MERAKESLAVSFYVFLFFFLGPVTTVILFYTLLFTQYWPLPLAYGVWWLYDLPSCYRGGRSGPWVSWCRQWSVWRYVVSYFPAVLVKTAELDPSRNYIICCHPHGLLCFGAASCFGTEAAGFSSLFPGIAARLTSIEGNLGFPVFRELFMLAGCISSSRNSLNHVLSRACGQAPVLLVGGVPEMSNSSPTEVRLYLRGRKGFAKMALRHGASLVPTFVFGETSLYNQDGFLARQLQPLSSTLGSWLGISPVIFNGRGWIQGGFGILPQRRRLEVVVGRPIVVDRVDGVPTQSQIDLLHGKYVDALTELYNKHNPDKNVKLVIA